MSDSVLNTFFWLAFAGLMMTMLGAAALFQAERQRGQRAARLLRASGIGPARRIGAGRSAGGSLAHLRDQLRKAVSKMGERLSAILGGEAGDTATELASAGFRSRDAVLIYAFLKTVLPLAAVILGLIWVLATTPFGLGMMMPVAKVIAAALGLSKGVDLFVANRRAKRMAAIRRGFPDLLELLVISSEAGLGPQPALHRVAVELHTSAPELSGEVLQMVSEMHMTNDRRAAYEKLSQRVPLPEIGVFTQTLDQSDTYGTPFSRAMRTLMDEQRTNRLMAVEEKAARLPVIMTLPLIFCIMPAVFVVLVGPAALSVIDNILAGG